MLAACNVAGMDAGTMVVTELKLTSMNVKNIKILNNSYVGFSIP